MVDKKIKVWLLVFCTILSAIGCTDNSSDEKQKRLKIEALGFESEEEYEQYMEATKKEIFEAVFHPEEYEARKKKERQEFLESMGFKSEEEYDKRCKEIVKEVKERLKVK